MQLSPKITFPSFLLLTGMEHSAFAIPALVIILSFNLLEAQAVLFIFLTFVLFYIPGSAGIMWLIAKGSNWVNGVPSIKAAGAIAGQTYCFVLGALIGVRLFGTLWGILGGILFSMLGQIIGMKLGEGLAIKFFRNNLIGG